MKSSELLHNSSAAQVCYVRHYHSFQGDQDFTFKVSVSAPSEKEHPDEMSTTKKCV